MRNLLFFFLLTFFWLTSKQIKSQEIDIVSEFETFEKEYLKNRSNDTIYVYNFWATWCKPCVQELPYFDSLNAYMGRTPIKLILVSLDFEEQIESVLKPFIKRNKILNEMVVLTDGKVNDWIDKVDDSWTGAIPATLVLKGKEKLFFERTFHAYNELLTAILKIE